MEQSEVTIAYFNNGLDVLSMLSRWQVPSSESVMIFMSSVLFCIVATLVLPGKMVQGVPLKDGSRITYKINGLSVVLLGTLFYGLLCYFNFQIGNELIYSLVCKSFGQLLVTSLVFSFLLTSFLNLRCVLQPERSNYVYPKWNIIMNFWCGVELNPHIFGFEIKQFSYRPAFLMIGILNLSFAFEQFRLYQTLSQNFITFQIISFLYLIDCFVFEEGLIFMFDIIEENFGFMLVFGDYMWTPFIFTLQNLYLINDFNVNHFQTVANILIFIVGYIIFRGANNQKITFRQDPKQVWLGLIEPKVLETSRDRKLLISGFWGMARKINYLGDILVAISQSFPCLQCGHVLPWMYPIYLTPLLLHRAMRDNERCKEKYGKFWDEYCSKVRWVMIPGIY
ncbi:ERG4/ERG24 ergosterol biosynthesis protein family protein [Naegleria gruberi]|uniref:Delta(14)-sterol reductase n=1 Tax=Naegleria gruberi TaxID=5762 RepID=D2VVT1_NAEGR|nr:ERG4/ERG24 ergosterol biosynthesis protein family protein [Naegleria gruberi]EFC39093.1 ERG4/ERG24 ergosterol biosynthesis protein family protein [Naegleria gruberi]|eukprot:XP_002671837.1 ERG4/ERG24 ergosterol biosynthesis protein family protein [Naegleria gruberi strain NEG-M]